MYLDPRIICGNIACLTIKEVNTCNFNAENYRNFVLPTGWTEWNVGEHNEYFCEICSITITSFKDAIRIWKTRLRIINLIKQFNL